MSYARIFIRIFGIILFAVVIYLVNSVPPWVYSSKGEPFVIEFHGLFWEGFTPELGSPPQICYPILLLCNISLIVGLSLFLWLAGRIGSRPAPPEAKARNR